MADTKVPGSAPGGYPPQPSAPPPYDDVAYPPPPEAQGQPPAKGDFQPGGADYSQPPVYYGPPQGQPTAQPTVVVTTVSSTSMFGDVPVSMQCPNCHNHITSNLIYKSGALVWLLVILILFVFQLWLGCCLIPFFFDALKDVRHVCPVCNYQLGVYKRL